MDLPFHIPKFHSVHEDRTSSHGQKISGMGFFVSVFDMRHSPAQMCCIVGNRLTKSQDATEQRNSDYRDENADR